MSIQTVTLSQKVLSNLNRRSVGKTILNKEKIGYARLVILLVGFLMFSALGVRAQCPFDESFESVSAGATSFTSNTKLFTITSVTTGPFSVINSGTPPLGWDGIMDSRYIDNVSASGSSPAAVKISNGTAFQLRSLYIFFSNRSVDINAPLGSGTITITGLNGATTIFTASLTSSSWNSNANFQNGFNFIDMASFGGQDNTFANITSFTVTGGTGVNYIAIDGMHWTDTTSIQPTQLTIAASGIGLTGATLNGSVNANSLTANDSFQYSTSPTLATGVITVAASPVTATGSSVTTFSKVLTGLTTGTTYYYRVKASNCNGNKYGSILSFVPSVAAPTTKIYIAPATNVVVSGNVDVSVSIDSFENHGTYTVMARLICMI